jgi:hypothetical protein
MKDDTQDELSQDENIDLAADAEITPLDGGLTRVPIDVREESEEERLLRLSAAEEHQERAAKGRPRGKL